VTTTTIEQQKNKLILIRDLRVFLLRAHPQGTGDTLEKEVHAWLNCKEFLDQTERLTIEAIKGHNKPKDTPTTPAPRKKAAPKKRKK